MAVKAKLDAVFATNVTVNLVHEFWRVSHEFKQQLDSTLIKMNGIAADPRAQFNTIDPEIVAEGGAVINALTACQTALNAHLEFLNWVEPS